LWGAWELLIDEIDRQSRRVVAGSRLLGKPGGRQGLAASRAGQAENGGAKLGHGSGGIVLLRAV